MKCVSQHTSPIQIFNLKQMNYEKSLGDWESNPGLEFIIFLFYYALRCCRYQ